MTTPDVNRRLEKGRTAVLAGNGRLPEIIADNLASATPAPFVVAVTDDTGEWIERHDHARIPVTRLASIMNALKAAGIDNVVLAGGIRARPSIANFKIDWTTIKMLFGLFSALRKGDDGLLRFGIHWLESQGFKVVGAHEVAPSLLTPEGRLTLLGPQDMDLTDMAVAVAAARKLGKADIGQAAVARAGAVVAVEDRKGTKAMLEGLASSQNGIARSGVIAKFAKPQQELRVDLPAIGPETVAQAANAALAGIVVEAGKSLILDRSITIAKANELGIFIVGMRD